jgi:hypothetical protein
MEMKLTIEKSDLITLIKLAQTEDDDWSPDYDVFLANICKAFNNIHIEPKAIDGVSTSTLNH